MKRIAVLEAHKLGIPVIGVVDTNCDPDVVDYPIPGNDDAIRSVQLFCQEMAEAINEGKSLLEQDGGEQAAGEEVSQDEKDAVVAEAMSEEDFGEDEE